MKRPRLGGVFSCRNYWQSWALDLFLDWSLLQLSESLRVLVLHWLFLSICDILPKRDLRGFPQE